ncbi:oxidreductase B/ cytochrome P450 monooxygenase [Tothia fuscella]|uniref:Oxidreductase B/ cytochrome P450 monooxygenase n=1 Tax=Tothia fuscella TaxID=1048955 RepID=A0A9P4NK93_9PEZI|nr:oxidreductase B/ cytochrome P450 monooxygenase [Tothia fuscella]
MPSYAVLGATGNTGTAILEILRQRSENKIHAFVRSASKLKAQQPQLYQSGQLQIFEGQLSNTEALAKCLENTRAAFMCIAAVANLPYCTLSQDAAKAVIIAMEQLRSKNQWLPRLIQLNSSSTDEKLSASLPKIAHTILYRGSWWIYEDLRASESMLRSLSSWLDVTFIMPGGLIQDAQKGHKLSTEKQQTFLGWLDLAAGMVEVADEESDVWRGKNVSVLPVVGDVPVNWMVPWYMVLGMCLTYAPWSYGAMKRLGLV